MAILQVTVPDPLTPRVLAAIRGTYPQETTGMTDVQVGRYFMRRMLRQVTADFEEREAEATMKAAGTQARNAANQATVDIS